MHGHARALITFPVFVQLCIYFALFNFTMISIFFARKCTASPLFGNANETLTLVFEVVRSVHSVLTI